MDKQRINLKIGAYTVPLDVPRDQEEIYRKAAVLLNERYNIYLRQRPQASVEQLWMYVALEMAVNLNADARDKAIQPIEEKINEINNKVLSTLNKQQ